MTDEKMKELLIISKETMLKHFKKKITELLPKILPLCALVSYDNHYDDGSHSDSWGTELEYFLLASTWSNLSCSDFKSISKEEKRKVLEEIWTLSEYDTQCSMHLEICHVFEDEDIDITAEEYWLTVERCINIKDKLFNTILSRDSDAIKNFVKSV